MACEPMSWRRPVTGLIEASGAIRAARGGGGGGLGPVVALPTLQQPGGHRQFGGAVGPGGRIGLRLAQHGVHQARGGALGSPLHQFDALGHGGVSRNPLQVAQLVDAHAKSQAHFQVQAGGPAAREAMDQEIQLRLAPQRAEDDFVRQTGVARIQPAGSRQEQLRGVTAALDGGKYFERGDAGRRHRC